jgi:hypothetical protein
LASRGNASRLGWGALCEPPVGNTDGASCRPRQPRWKQPVLQLDCSIGESVTLQDNMIILGKIRLYTTRWALLRSPASFLSSAIGFCTQRAVAVRALVLIRVRITKPPHYLHPRHCFIRSKTQNKPSQCIRGFMPAADDRVHKCAFCPLAGCLDKRLDGSVSRDALTIPSHLVSRVGLPLV